MKKSLSVLALAALATQAGAARDQSDGSYSIDPQMAAAMERDLGISQAELPRHLAAEAQAMAFEATASARLGDEFAGSWMETLANGEFRHVVATTGEAGKLAMHGVEVIQAQHSLSQLEAAVEDLNQTMSRLTASPIPSQDSVALEYEADNVSTFSAIHNWYVDVKTNRVVVTIAEGADATVVDFLSASQIDPAMLTIETEQGRPMTAVWIYGGRQYGTGGGSCSIGFAVRRGSTRGFVTAGHCGSAGTSVRVGGATVGQVRNSSFPGDDLAWANVRSSDTLQPFVNRYNGGTVRDVRVNGTNVASVGASVCRSGFASGYRCGTITARNVTVNYSAGPTFGLTRSSACLTQGDSGGSWITGGGQAQGVSSGGQLGGSQPPFSNCQFSNPVSFFQPVREILNRYNLTIAR